MTSQTNLDYIQSLPDLVAEYEQEAAQLNHTFNQGFYLGSQHEAKQHLWYLLFGLVAGFVSGAAGMYWML